MERKIGEIFEYHGEWYQCIEDENKSCGQCDLSNFCPYNRDLADNVGNCSKNNRSDGESIIFKKLEKVGEPFTSVGKLYQHYKVFDIDNVYGDVFWCVHNYKAKTLTIEIKQNKEEMEEKKIQHYDCFFDGKSSKSNLKPFDLKAAKAGKPVCTRDGRKARIICFDRISGDDYYKIVACVTAFDGDFEEVLSYGIDGYTVDSQNPKDEDLMMLPEKKEGLVNVYRDCDGANITKDDNIYSSKEAAMASAQIIDRDNYVATTKINWEE